MKKRLLIIATVLALGGLVGCGNKQGTTTSESGTGTTQTVTTTNVAEVKAAAEALNAGAFSTEKYTVTGYVVTEPYLNTKYNSYSFDVSDSKDATSGLYCYSCTLASGVNAPVKGSQVTVNGFLTLFVKDGQPNKPEMAGSSSVEYPVITACDAKGTPTGGGTTTSAPTTSQAQTSIALGEKESLMQYTAGTTTNFVATNNAATVGLDANVFTVTSTLYESNSGPIYCGLNKANQIRIYAGQSLYIEATSDIDTIEITYESASKNATVYVGTNAVTATDGKYTINAKKVEIKNAENSGQVHITSVKITLK